MNGLDMGHYRKIHNKQRRGWSKPDVKLTRPEWVVMFLAVWVLTIALLGAFASSSQHTAVSLRYVPGDTCAPFFGRPVRAWLTLHEAEFDTYDVECSVNHRHVMAARQAGVMPSQVVPPNANQQPIPYVPPVPGGWQNAPQEGPDPKVAPRDAVP